MKKLKVIFFPKDSNPYQELLKTAIYNEKNIEIIYGKPFIPFRVIEYRLKGYNIFHLHWLFPFQFYIFRKYDFIYKLVSTLYLIIFIFILKILRYKIVYTIHDIESHDKQFLSESWATWFITKVSDAVISHSQITKDKMINKGYKTQNTQIIPIGTYLNIYENIIKPKEAKVELNIRDKDFVFLFFGLIKNYKGVTDLVSEFNKLSKVEDNIKLIIAGNCFHENLKSEIKKMCLNNNNILTFIEHIPNEKVQVLFNSADVTVLPFKKVTTSSTAILSLSFGKPIIAPRIGELSNFPDKVGFFYESDSAEGLIDSMKYAIKNKSSLTQKSKEGLKFTKNLSWDSIGKKTYDLYLALS